MDDFSDIPDVSSYSYDDVPTEMPGSPGSSLQYGSDIEPSQMPGSPDSTLQYGSDIGGDTPIDWSQVQGNPSLWNQLTSGKGALGSLSRLFGQGGQFNLSDLMNLGKLGVGLGGTYAAYNQARQAQNLNQAAQARLAQRQAALSTPLKKMTLQRQYLGAPANPAEAAYHGGGLQFFSPTTYMASGGAVSNYADGGQADVGGQSDNVPIMAAHGEYVIPADVVAALGDGNNEAGSQKLDQMVQQIRQSARSAGPKDLPPKAGDAGDYLS